MRRLRELFSDLATATGFALFVLSLILVLVIVVAIPFGSSYSFFGFLVLFALTMAGGLIFVFGVFLNKKDGKDEDRTLRFAVPKDKMPRSRFPRFPRLRKPRWLRGYATLDFSDLRQRRRLYFFMAAGVIEILLMSTGGFRLAVYSESSEFCGELCHSVMSPEYTTYLESPHARVDCATCHVGPGASWLVKSKINGLPQIAAVILNTYERPIKSPVLELRPARDTCEQCHWPEKLSGDLLRVHRYYLADEENTEQVDIRGFKVGGGHSDTARDIHWHIGAKVWYLALDDTRQEIGWVGVADDGREIVEYIDPDKLSEVNTQRIEDEKRLMDCIDCHNRATHIFYSPNELIDMAIVQGKIDRSLPYIKREGLEALEPANPSLDEAIAKVEAIEDFYRTTYPDIYTEKRSQIIAAIEELKGIAKLTTFPDMKVDWKTYPDNIGHLEWPGCFRCHGKLVAIAGEQSSELIDASCNTCHYPL